MAPSPEMMKPQAKNVRRVMADMEVAMSSNRSGNITLLSVMKGNARMAITVTRTGAAFLIVCSPNCWREMLESSGKYSRNLSGRLRASEMLSCNSRRPLRKAPPRKKNGTCLAGVSSKTSVTQ